MPGNLRPIQDPLHCHENKLIICHCLCYFDQCMGSKHRVLNLLQRVVDLHFLELKLLFLDLGVNKLILVQGK